MDEPRRRRWHVVIEAWRTPYRGEPWLVVGFLLGIAAQRLLG